MSKSSASGLQVALIGLASLAVAVGVGRFAYTPLLPMMLTDGKLDLAAGGDLASAHFLGYFIGALTAARAPFGPRAMLRGSLVAIGGSAVGMGLTDNYAIWMLLRFGAGVASAWCLTLIGAHCVARLAGLGRPGLQGYVFSGVGVGVMLAGFACLVFMARDWSSDDAWLVTGAAALTAAGLVSVGLDRQFGQTAAAPGRPTTGKRAPLHWPSVLAYGAMGFGYIVPATYLPLMAKAAVPDPAVFGWAWPAFGAAAALSTALAGRLWARVGDRPVWIGGQVVMAAGVAAPAIWPDIVAVAASGLIVGGTFMIVTMAGLKAAHRIAPPADAMRHVAAFTAAFALGQTIGPALAATAHDLTGAFAGPLAVVALALALTAAYLAARP